MKEPPEKHPWARFKAPSSSPRPPAPKGGPQQPAADPALGKATKPPISFSPRPLPMPRPAPAPPSETKPPAPPPRETTTPQIPPAKTVPPAAPLAEAKPKPGAAPANWAIPKRASEANPGYADLINAAEEAVEAAETAEDDPLLALVKEGKPGRRTKGKRTEEKANFRTRLADSVAHPRQSGERFVDWWSRWRKTSSAKAFVAFVIIYALLAVARKPSEVVLEQSRHAEEMSVLQDFLNSYAKAGGTVLAERPHGGSELFPRGVVMQGEFLEAFQRAPVGETYNFTLTNPDANPLLGFYGFPPIYAGGKYFHLERKFNLTYYRFRFLMRKDSEQAGAILFARLELAF